MPTFPYPGGRLLVSYKGPPLVQGLKQKFLTFGPGTVADTEDEFV